MGLLGAERKGSLGHRARQDDTHGEGGLCSPGCGLREKGWHEDHDTPRVQGKGALSLSPGTKDLSQEESTTTSSESNQMSADHRALIPRNQLRSTHSHPRVLYLHHYRPSKLVTGPPKAYK